MTQIKIEPEAMQEIVHRAIMEQIGPEERERILSSAVAALLAQPKSGEVNWMGHRGKSVLESAYETAIHGAAIKVVREMIEGSEEGQEAIRKAVTAPMEGILSGNYDLSEQVGEAIGRTVAEWIRDRTR